MNTTDPEMTIGKQYFFEKDRLQSFKLWPHSDKNVCSIKNMAEAGWFFSGNEEENDSATCFLCGKVLDGWESTDDPWREHKNHAPQCAFVKFGRPERDLTVAEMLDLMESFIKKRSTDTYDQVSKSLVDSAAEMKDLIKIYFSV